MALINITNAQLAYGDNPLLDKAEFVLQPGERVCLVGRNGAGKSTLMKVIHGTVLLDDGSINRQTDLKVSRLEQDPPRDAEGTVVDYVAEGLAEVGALLKQYHELLGLMETDPSETNINRLARVQEQLDHHGAWHFENQITQVLDALKLDGNKKLSELSGGWQRKAALARALVCDPDILLLDEPTNHLDVATIMWLENFLKDFKGSIIFISHDRAFIRSMATRIVDLDRGMLSSFPGDYEMYLEGKEEALRVEAEQNALFDKKLAQEETWIRQGIKARRTRNEGRVRALKQLRRERSERVDVMGKANIQLDDAARSGKIVFEAKNIGYQWGEKRLIEDFSFNVMRGDRIALIGPNGCGKSTLLKVMLQQLEADSGSFHVGTKLDVAYFDQYREKLDPEKTVIDNLAEGKLEVDVGGKKRHVLGYLQDFLFHPRRARTPVKALSGGEKNRLLLARLFLKPANLLVLDEPTNDLDIETLELLEELLANYQGTLLLVSHDRQFVDNTVTHSWVFEGDGLIRKFVGGYHDAMQQRENYLKATETSKPQKTKPETSAEVPKKAPEAKKTTKKLSYKLQRELEALPQLLENLENEISHIQESVNDPAFFQRSNDETQTVLQRLSEAEAELEVAFERWEELEEMQKD
ncbi:ABC transporter ATP-binding protein [Enterovibrio norvegicus]|uniref:ATP-binding protein Uup n=2 Tax=Enterovibrio norvegicus TaxID=188144 RepID=A0A2N7L4B9_9GAMM|nr:ABC transporter ATP-binding protein [Enterovibrio norvegicus]OEF49971.1 ABC transporter ATP-binding protein [Enterovibrio norvegicus]OEF58036.1 ABC transporter ATP-binding protein [Enterovibrio norvegicus]PMH65375.1 ABC transporter ATP-binding protein [Enterovibrio norvegicus]PMN88216.1 ABC transporter ATP-binding protein [Enterovibrio norvegicus]SFQ18596.1 ATP-binding cassette, subfamily F, uup [Enterovibrio norvegicus DSM 15893]